MTYSKLDLNNYKVRLMKKEDISKIVEIYSQTDASDSNKIKKLYQEFYKKPNLKKYVKDYVILDGDKIIGFSGFAKEETGTENVFWLNWTAVDDFYKNKGAGRYLLEFIFKKLKLFKARKLYVITTTESKYKPAIKFYQSLGFLIEGKLKDYYRKGVDSVMLGKEL